MVLASRVGWQAAQAAEANRLRQHHLSPAARDSDPSAPARSIERRRRRDDLERARIAFQRASDE